MYGDTVTFGQAAVVCLFSMVVVFFVLLTISYMIDAVAYFINKSEKGAVTEAKKETPVAVPVPEPAPADDHIDVVLITAAVAAYLGEDSSTFVVRSIRRIGAEETARSRAGRLDSLQ